jgi:ribosomal-protein-alanine N-acetyltransferase
MTYIGGIGVLPSLRRRGLGLALTHKVLDTHEAVWLHVRVNNIAAIRMYERLGMVIARQLSHFYSDGADAYVMSTVGAQT